MEEDKNLEQNSDKSNEKSDISDFRDSTIQNFLSTKNIKNLA